MVLFNTLKKKLGGLAFPALNLYKLALYLALFASWTVFVHTRATNRCEMEYQKQQTVLAEKKIVAIAEEIKIRTPVILAKQKKTIEANVRVRQAEQEIDYATQLRETNPSCDISDAELAGYGVLADEINSATGNSGVRDKRVR